MSEKVKKKVKKFSSAHEALAFIKELKKRKIRCLLNSILSKERRDKKGMLLSADYVWIVTYKKKEIK